MLLSLKQTAKTTEDQWLEDFILSSWVPVGLFSVANCLLVLGRVRKNPFLIGIISANQSAKVQIRDDHFSCEPTNIRMVLCEDGMSRCASLRCCFASLGFDRAHNMIPSSKSLEI